MGFLDARPGQIKDKYFYTQDELEGKGGKGTNVKAVLPATDHHGDVNDEQRCPKCRKFTES